MTGAENPLSSLDDWDDDVLRRYPEDREAGNAKQTEEFRSYGDAPEHVREFYCLNHRQQTVKVNRQKRDEFRPLKKRRMSIWEAMEFLNTLVDDSDPDTNLSQIEHLLQTAEAIRADGHPPWFVLTGLIHDLGKILCLFDEPQWCVTGDTFPVGCRFDSSIVYHDSFFENPDFGNPEYNSEFGIYEPNCGLRNVMLSWGHDEYMFNVCKEYLPEEGLAMIRYHSFYPWHSEGAYRHLMDEHDHKMLEYVKLFNPYDLYSKSDDPPDVEQLRPFYEALIAEFFPTKIAW